MDTLRFEWDPNKNEINKKKHGLSFEAAKEVFYDEFAILFDDPDHSIEEDRFLYRINQIAENLHCEPLLPRQRKLHPYYLGKAGNQNRATHLS